MKRAQTAADRYGARLRAERDGLLATLPPVSRLAEMFPQSEAVDPEDRSVQEVDRDVLLGIVGRRGDRVASIDAALERLADGSFGACIDCEEPVGPARLDADPAAARCVGCESLREARGPLRTH